MSVSKIKWQLSLCLVSNHQHLIRKPSLTGKPWAKYTSHSCQVTFPWTPEANISGSHGLFPDPPPSPHQDNHCRSSAQRGENPNFLLSCKFQGCGGSGVCVCVNSFCDVKQVVNDLDLVPRVMLLSAQILPREDGVGIWV